MMRFGTIIAAGVALATPAVAADWQFVYGTAKEMVYLDRASVQSDASARRVWLRRDHYTKGIENSKELWSIDCKRRTMSPVVVTDYGPGGNPVGSSDFRTLRVSPDPVIPDTLGEMILVAACDPNWKSPLPARSESKSDAEVEDDLERAADAALEAVEKAAGKPK